MTECDRCHVPCDESCLFYRSIDESLCTMCDWWLQTSDSLLGGSLQLEHSSDWQQYEESTASCVLERSSRCRRVSVEESGVILICCRVWMLESSWTDFYLRQEGYVFVVVCLFVCLFVSWLATSKRICMKFSGKVGNGPLNKCLTYIVVAIRITIWIQGLFSEFVNIGRYGKWYQPTALRDAAVHGML